MPASPTGLLLAGESLYVCDSFYFGFALLAVELLTLLAALGVLDALDNAACDTLYQSRNAPDGEIVLIGIDDRAIEELEP